MPEFQFKEIGQTDGGYIKGKKHDGKEVVIPDREWTENQNWEEISKSLLNSTVDVESNREFSNNSLQISKEKSIEILRDEGYVEHPDGDETQEKLKAQLLIEYLCSEGIYSLENSKISILRDPDDSLSKGVVINWATLFEIGSEKIETIIQTAEDKQSELMDKFTGMSVETDLQQRYDELYEDVYRISNGNERAIAAGINSDDIDVPDSVAKENKSEYKKKVAQLGKYFPVVSEEVDDPLPDENGNPEEIMSQIIGELEAQMKTFDHHSQRLRQQVTVIEAREMKDAIEEIGDILSEFDFLSVDEQDIDAKTLRDATSTSVNIEEPTPVGPEEPPNEFPDEQPKNEKSTSSSETNTVGEFMNDLSDEPER